jgi:hypothetical protein
VANASTTAENSALSSLVGTYIYLSLHSATPGTTGASEISGGTYARVSVTWGTPASGSVSNTNTLTVNVPASTTVAFFGLWSAATAGTYGIGGSLSSSQTFNTAGTYTIAAGGLTLTAS